MKTAFDGKSADFSGEAAAATAVAVAVAAAVAAPEPPPEPFHVDRPFLFYLVDDETGAIRFQGRVADPR
jgi:serpin B